MISPGVRAAVFLSLLINRQVMSGRVDSRVVLDVNPSILMTTNKKAEVMNLKGGNPDGGALLKGLASQGRPFIEVMETILDPLMEAQFSTDEDKTSLWSVFHSDSGTQVRQKQELDIPIPEHLRNREITPRVLNINPSE